jgi:hypothetical protein
MNLPNSVLASSRAISTTCSENTASKPPATDRIGWKRRYRIGDEAAAAALKELDRRALAAQECFRTHGPAWAQPLPVSWPKLCMWARVGKFLEAGILAPDNGRWELLASFAISWFETKFDPTHPSFNRFARGVMADKSTPARLRDNPELRKEYPPKRLSTWCRRKWPRRWITAKPYWRQRLLTNKPRVFGRPRYSNPPDT